jgi:hypothetical protein
VPPSAAPAFQLKERVFTVLKSRFSVKFIGASGTVKSTAPLPTEE